MYLHVHVFVFRSIVSDSENVTLTATVEFRSTDVIGSADQIVQVYTLLGEYGIIYTPQYVAFTSKYPGIKFYTSCMSIVQI